MALWQLTRQPQRQRKTMQRCSKSSPRQSASSQCARSVVCSRTALTLNSGKRCGAPTCAAEPLRCSRHTPCALRKVLPTPRLCSSAHVCVSQWPQRLPQDRVSRVVHTRQCIDQRSCHICQVSLAPVLRALARLVWTERVGSGGGGLGGITESRIAHMHARRCLLLLSEGACLPASPLQGTSYSHGNPLRSQAASVWMCLCVLRLPQHHKC